MQVCNILYLRLASSTRANNSHVEKYKAFHQQNVSIFLKH